MNTNVEFITINAEELYQASLANPITLTKAQSVIVWTEYTEALQACEARVRGAEMRYFLAHARYLEFCDSYNKQVAAAHGWIVARSNRSRLSRIDLKRRKWPHVDLLCHPLVDHDVGFRERTRPYLPVALLSHTYVPLDRLALYTDKLKGYRFEVLPWSCYYPNVTTALIVKPPPRGGRGRN